MKLFVLALLVAAAAAAPLADSNGPVELIVNGVPEGQPLEIGNIVDIKLKEHSAGEVIATNLLHPLTAVGLAEAAAAAVVENPTPVEAMFLPGLAEIEAIVPQPIALPSPAKPEVVPEPIALPSPAKPEVVIPESIVLPSPAKPEVVMPEPIALPSPASPEVVLPESVISPEIVVPEPIVLPGPAIPEVVIPQPIALPGPSVPALPEAVIPQPIALPGPLAPENEVVEPIPAAQLPTGEIFNDGNVQVIVNTPETGVFSTIQGWFSMVLNYFDNGVQTSQQIV